MAGQSSARDAASVPMTLNVVIQQQHNFLPEAFGHTVLQSASLQA